MRFSEQISRFGVQNFGPALFSIENFNIWMTNFEITSFGRRFKMKIAQGSLLNPVNRSILLRYRPVFAFRNLVQRLIKVGPETKSQKS